MSSFPFKIMFFIACFLVVRPVIQAQNEEVDARNGWGMAPYGHFHVLVIFAEIDFDSSYGHLNPTPKGGSKDWKEGQLPWWRNSLFDKDTDRDAFNGYMTQYFMEASFGKFHVTGDYIDSLISIPISSIRNQAGKVVTQEPFGNNFYRKAVIERVNQIGLKTAYGSTEADFDRWTLSGAGLPKKETPNENWDMVMIIWRNIHVKNLGDQSGFVTPGNFGKILGRDTDSYSMFRMSFFVPKTIMRHEFSHMLYGGNNFHTAAAGVGARTFLAPAGGWSNMSNAGRCSPTWNAWDRERMGWKNPEKAYLLSAMCELGREEVPTSLEYGQEFPCGQGKFILRDFVTTGDAIKIKLPVSEGQKQQYLWLENHQLLPGRIDHNKAMSKGIYAFISVGKDDLTGSQAYGEANNYTWPLVAEGNFDFGYRPSDKTLLMDDANANKFTGINYLITHAADLNNDGIIQTASIGENVENFRPERLEINGVAPPEEYFSYRTLPEFGTSKMAWGLGKYNKIGLDENPTAVPVLTHFTPGDQPQNTDMRRILLNGISVTVTQEDFNGDVHVKIRWDDFDLSHDARWCGNILAREGFNLRNGAKISLEQGLTPQNPRAVQEIEGKKIFAEPTVLEIGSGATVEMASNTEILVKKGSTLLIRAGSSLNMERNAKITVEEGGFLYVEKGASISRKGPRTGFIYEDANVGLNTLMEAKLGPVLPIDAPPSGR
ncbi:MAG: hypothetical protein H6581_21045 [Bacteroidia bacterium]|nr:hypothetical protein [Bacteroidia bacterium]